MGLQLGAIAILTWAALATPRLQPGRPGRQLGFLIAALIALVAVQLIPLPPSVWSSMPGRAPIADGLSMLGLSLPWLPLSLAPYATMSSALGFLVPLAILAGMLRLGAYRDSWLVIAMIVAAVAGVMLGALQVTSSDPLNSPWYIHAVTNHGQATGFFANSNHMATLLVATLPFLIALPGPPRSRSQKVSDSASKIAILGGVLLVILVGIALNNSLAGLGLGVTVLGASLLVRTPLQRARARWGLVAVGVLGLITIGTMFAAPFGNDLTTASARTDVLSRYTTFNNSLRATADHFPTGSGLGTFAELYPIYEDPATVDLTYVNHAHNDYIEFALEGGLPAIVLMVMFLLWWVTRTVAVWRASEINYVARAASIASGAILAHSVVDFPLRMSGIAALFAMCLALLVRPRPRTIEYVTQVPHGDARHLSVGDLERKAE